MRRRPERLRALAMMVGLLAAGLVAPAAHADGVTDQQQQVKDDLAEIQRLEQKSSELNEQYLGYVNDKAALEAEIAAGQVQVDAQSAQVAAMQEQLASVAVAQFTGGGVDAFALFGNTASATDGLQREQLVRSAVNAGAVNADDYETQLEQLNHAQDDLTAKQAKVSKLAEQAASTLAATQQAGQAYQDELASDQARLGDLLVQEQQRQLEQAAADHAADVAKAQAAQVQAAQDKATHDQAAQDQAAQDQAAQDQAAASSSSSNNGSNGSSGSSSSGNVSAGNDGSSATSAPATPATTAPALVASPVTAPPSNDDSASSSASNSDSGSSSDSGSGSGSAQATTADTSSSSSDSPPPVSSRASVAVAAAKSQLGVRYQYAMSSPGIAFDCSGLTSYAWAQAGASIPHQSGQQYASTPHISLDDLQPGDLLFYYSPISHVAMYVGNGQVIQAPAPGKFVEIVAVNWSKVIGASRPG